MKLSIIFLFLSNMKTHRSGNSLSTSIFYLLVNIDELFLNIHLNKLCRHTIFKVSFKIRREYLLIAENE